MSDLTEYPDIEAVTIAALADLCDNVATETPPDPDGTLMWLPFVKVQCLGGADDTVTDDSLLAVDVYASTKGAAAQLAGKVRQRLTGTPAPAVAGKGVIDIARTVSKPHYVPYVSNPPPYRYAATYRPAMRRTTTT